MKRGLVLSVLWVLMAVTACSSPSETVDLPTRVIIATLPPLEDTVLSSPVAETRAPIAQQSPETIITDIDAPTTLEPDIEPTQTLEITTEPEQPVVVPSNTITNTPTREPTATPTETIEPQAISFLAELALELTIVLPTDRPYVTNTPIMIYQQSADPNNPWAIVPPQTVQPNISTTCPNPPAGVFMNVVTANPSTLTMVGCPVGQPPVTSGYSGAVQMFERGMMLWVGTAPNVIYVLYNDGTMARYDDTFIQGVDPDEIGQTPPPNLIAPIRGFGKVWSNDPFVQSGLGWATQGEQGLDLTVHEFTSGRMIYISQQNRVYVLSTQANTWQAVSP